MNITTSQILDLTLKLIDGVGEITNRGFTEGEEASLAVDVQIWLVQHGVEVVPE